MPIQTDILSVQTFKMQLNNISEVDATLLMAFAQNYQLAIKIVRFTLFI